MPLKKRKFSKQGKGAKGDEEGVSGGREAPNPTFKELMEMLKGMELSKEEKVELLDLAVSNLSKEDLRETKVESKKKFVGFYNDHELGVYKRMYLKEEHALWLDKVPKMLPYLAYLAEYIFFRVDPGTRGHVNIQFPVPDLPTLEFLNVLAKVEGWNTPDPQTKPMNAFPCTSEVTHFKIWTDKMDSFKEFLLSFNIKEIERVPEQHWLQKTGSGAAIPIPIPKEKLDFSSAAAIARMKNEMKKEAGWSLNDFTVIKSTVVRLGDYVVPGTITSACVQRELTREMREGMGLNSIGASAERKQQTATNAEGNTHEPPKVDKRRAKFVMEFKCSAFPKSQFGILSVSFNYDCLTDGVRDGN